MRGLISDHPRTERCAQALMTQANTEDGHLTAELLDGLHRDAGVFRPAGAWRDDYSLVTSQLGNCDRVVAKDGGLSAELAKVLHQGVGERGVVVDDSEFRRRHHMASAISMALKIAPACSNVSSTSRSGVESATTPAPAAGAGVV